MTERRGLRHRAIQRWEQFWFEDVPSDLFALVRIAIGTAGLINLIGLLPVGMFWSLDGIFPLPGGGYGLKTYVLDSGLGVIVGWTIFLTLFASFVCMIVGLFTGVAVIVCFLGSSLQVRWNALPLTSGHTVLVAVLFCLVWADCGSWPSVDAWRKRGLGSPLQPIWPLRLIRAQVALVYLSSGLFKLLGAVWRDGSAIHYITGHNVYGRIFDVYALPASLDWVLTLTTYGTLFWELGFAFLLLNRTTRRVALLLGIAMHLGILALMEVGPFTWMMLATYVAFLDPHAVSQFVSRRFLRQLSSRPTTFPELTPTATSSTSAA